MQQFSNSTALVMILMLLIFLDSCWNHSRVLGWLLFDVVVPIVQLILFVFMFFAVLVAAPFALVAWLAIELFIFLAFDSSDRKAQKDAD